MKQQKQGVRLTKPKNEQANQIQDENVETNLSHPLAEIKRMCIVKFGTRKKQSALNRLENSLFN